MAIQAIAKTHDVQVVLDGTYVPSSPAETTSTPRTSDQDDNDGEVFHDAKHPGADYDPGTSTQLLQYVAEQRK